MNRHLCRALVRAVGDDQVDIRMSTGDLGRDGHVLVPQGAELANYRANPIMLWQHDPGMPVGRADNIRADAEAIAARVTFAPPGVSAKADEVRGLVKSGIINAVSVGFEPLDGVPLDPRKPYGGRRFTSWELLECSFVSVPADPGATVTARSAARPAMPPAIKRVEPLYPGAPKFKSLGEQLRAIALHERDGIDDSRLVRAATGASEVDPTAGGFLVQQDFAAELIGSLYENAVIAPLCTRDRTDFPGRERNLPAVDETSRADGSRWGGVLAYWLSEGASVTTKFPRFRRITMNTQKLIAVTYAVNELLDDSALLSAHMRRALGSELAFALDYTILRGSGAGQPLGLINSTAAIQIAKESGQSNGTIVFENVGKMFSRLPLQARRRACWLCAEDVEEQLGRLHYLASGTAETMPRVYQPAGAFGNEFPTLYGRPVIAVESAPTIGTVGDIVLADLTQYSILEGPPQMALSVDVAFLTDEVVFRFVLRVDGKLLWSSAVTPFNGGSTRSPVVTLAAR